MDNNRPIEFFSYDFFNSIRQIQTGLNIVYLLLSFPLGIIYFVLLITGISLGFGLLITVLGIFILMAVLSMCYCLAKFERRLAIIMLNININPVEERPHKPGVFSKFRSMLSNPFTWKGMFFIFLKFPLGVFSFSLIVALLATSLGLIIAPFFYEANWYDFDIGSWLWKINSTESSLIACFAGIILLYVSLYIINLFAWLSAQLAKLLLGGS